MANYWFSFGAQPSAAASLSPTFITFTNTSGATSAAPSITERPPGSGLYNVNYGATTSMAFVLDGATTGLATSQRYIPGAFDPQDNMSATLTVMGASLSVMGGSLSVMGGSLSVMGASLSVMGSSLNVMGSTLFGIGSTVTGIGNTLAGMVGASGFLTLLGDTSSSFGSTSVNPTTVFGFLKRSQEYAEGNRTYAKASGVLDYYSRGSSTLLIEKTITDNTSGTTCI